MNSKWSEEEAEVISVVKKHLMTPCTIGLWREDCDLAHFLLKTFQHGELTFEQRWSLPPRIWKELEKKYTQYNQYVWQYELIQALAFLITGYFPSLSSSIAVHVRELLFTSLFPYTGKSENDIRTILEQDERLREQNVVNKTEFIFPLTDYLHFIHELREELRQAISVSKRVLSKNEILKLELDISASEILKEWEKQHENQLD